MRYIVWLDSSRVATFVKVRSVTRVSSSDPTRVKSNYIPHILRFYSKLNAAMDVMGGGEHTGSDLHVQGVIIHLAACLFLKNNLGHLLHKKYRNQVNKHWLYFIYWYLWMIYRYLSWSRFVWDIKCHLDIWQYICSTERLTGIWMGTAYKPPNIWSPSVHVLNVK